MVVDVFEVVVEFFEVVVSVVDGCRLFHVLVTAEQPILKAKQIH